MNWILVWLMLVTQESSFFTDASQVFVSNNGADVPACGSHIDNSCKTIQYVFQNSRSFDTITLDGGEKQTMVYYTNTTLQITTNLTFTRFHKSRFNPILSTRILNSSSLFAFSASSISTKDIVLVQFKEVNFLDIGVLQCSEFCSIILSRCIIDMSRHQEVFLFNTTVPAIRSLLIHKCSKINIYESTFLRTNNNSGNLINADVCVSANIKNTNMYGTMTLNLLKVDHLHIDNCTFVNFTRTCIKAIGCRDCNASVTIINNRHLAHNLGNSQGDDAVLDIGNVMNVSIESTEIKHCISIYIFTLKAKTASLEKSIIKNNIIRGVIITFGALIINELEVLENNLFDEFSLIYSEETIRCYNSSFIGNILPLSDIIFSRYSIKASHLTVTRNEARHVLLAANTAEHELARISLSRSIFLNNIMRGSIAFSAGTLEINHTALTKNEIKETKETSLIIAQSTVHCYNTSFIGNRVPLSDIIFSYYEIMASNLTVINNEVGHIFSTGNETSNSVIIHLSNSIIFNNSLRGSIVASTGTLELSHLIIQDNQSREKIVTSLIYAQGSINCYHSSFIRNNLPSTYDILFSTHSITASNLTVEHNEARHALFTGNEAAPDLITINLSQMVFSNNNLHGSIVATFGTVEISDLIVTENEINEGVARMHGKYFATHKMSIKDCKITKNNAKRTLISAANELVKVKLSNLFIFDNTIAGNIEVRAQHAYLANIDIIDNQMGIGVQGVDIILGASLYLEMINITVNSTSRPGYTNIEIPLVIPSIVYNLQINKASLNPLSLRYTFNRTPEPEEENTSQNTLFQASVSCIEGYNSYFVTEKSATSNLVSIRCDHCNEGTYALTGGKTTLNVTSSNLSQINKTEPIHCKNCPTGGVCKLGETISRGNFYGFKHTDTTFKYISCLTFYCCSTYDECATSGSCAPFRDGKLCGKCKENFQENFFSQSKCIEVSRCTNVVLFWIVFTAALLLIVIVWTYLEEVISFFAKFCQYIKEILQKYCTCVNKKQALQDTYTLGYDQTVENPNTNRCISIQISSDNCRKHYSSSMKVISSGHLINSRSTFRRRTKSLDVQSEKIINGLVSGESKLTEQVNDESMILRRSTAGSLNTSEQKDDAKTYTFSGIISILTSYYQTKSLLTVGKMNIGLETPEIVETISRLFNLDVFFEMGLSLCPMQHLDQVKKHFIKYFLFNLLMPGLALLGILITLILKQCGKPKIVASMTSRPKSHSQERSLACASTFPFIDRLFVSYIRLLLLVYKNLALFSIVMINCVSMKDVKVLFIQGTLQCYHKWQYSLMVFLFLWVIPFPIALWQSYSMFTKKQITRSKFLLCLTIPISTLWFNFNHCIDGNVTTNKQRDDMFCKKVKEIFTEPYRLRKSSKEDYISWEQWRLMQKLLLSCIATFLVNPLERVCYITPFILFFVFVYIHVRPFKKELKLLHWCEVTSMISICFSLVVNCFNAFLFTYNISTEEPVPTLYKYFMLIDGIFSPLTLLILYFISQPLWNMIKKKIVKDK